MNVISGQKCYELSKVANHDTLWLKMLLVMSQWASTKCLLTWKIKDTPQGRLLYQLVPKTHHTEDQEYGSSDSLLPTPTPQEIEHPEVTLTKNNRRLSKDGKSSHSLNLADTMKLWPTPAAYEDRTSVQAIKKLPKDRQKMKMSNLSTHVRVTQEQMWPTPTASDVEGGIAKDVQTANGRFFRQNEKGEKWGVKLRDAVNYTEKTRLLPTPTTRDYKDTGNIDKWNENMDRDSLPRRIFHMEKKKFWPTPAASDNRDRGNLSNPSVQRRIKLGKQVGLTMAVKEENTMGTLNSEWVTWLMGYPEGYLDISTENQNISQELQKEKKTEPKS